MRLSSNNCETENPKTGEFISFGNLGGDAELLDPQTKEWSRRFFWGASGRISFRGDEAFQQSDTPMRSVGSALAEALGAIVEDEYGTVYK